MNPYGGPRGEEGQSVSHGLEPLCLWNRKTVNTSREYSPTGKLCPEYN